VKKVYIQLEFGKNFLMHRRDFLKLSAGLAGAMAILPTGVMSLTPDEANPVVGRLVFEMNQNWRFSPQRIEGATGRDFDDSHFEHATLPHVNGMPSVESALTYRRKFRLPLNARGHHVLADFSGSVPRCLTVWINGRCVRHGYRYFSSGRGRSSTCDLTPHVDWLGENVLVAEVGSGPFARLPDYNYNFNLRHVQFRLMPPAYVEILGAQSQFATGDEGSVKVWQFVTCPGVQTARLTLETEMRAGSRVIATGRMTLDPADEIDRTVWVYLTLTDRTAGELMHVQTKTYACTLISRLKRDDAIIDEDQSPLLWSVCWRRKTSGSII